MSHLRLLWIPLVVSVMVQDKALATPLKTLTIAADIWCPINCSPETPPFGIGIDLAKKVFEPLGYSVNYTLMPWSRALEYVRAGKIDAVVGANHEDDATLIFPEHAIYTLTDDYYVRTGSALTFDDIKSSNSVRIGIIKDYGYGKETQKIIADRRKTADAVQEVGGDDALEQNLRKLAVHRIDVIIESRPVMQYTLRKLHEEDSVDRVGTLPQGNVYVAFSPALVISKTRKEQYDAGIEKLKATGKLSAIYAPYGLRP